MNPERSNERSALTLLALLQLDAASTWRTAQAPMLRVRDIMDWVRDELMKDYAPNTRETIRRFTFHQFVAAGLVIENPDEPGRPVNSPNCCYQVGPAALETVHLTSISERSGLARSPRSRSQALGRIAAPVLLIALNQGSGPTRFATSIGPSLDSISSATTTCPGSNSQASVARSYGCSEIL